MEVVISNVIDNVPTRTCDRGCVYITLLLGLIFVLVFMLEMVQSFGSQPNITVHHFSAKQPLEVSRSLLLQEGRNLVFQGAGEESWSSRPVLKSLRADIHCCKSFTFKSHFQQDLHLELAQFLYPLTPPLISGTRSTELKEWGSPANESEFFNLNNLVEFISTDFSQAPKRKLTDGGIRSMKRRLDNKPLNLLIPQVIALLWLRSCSDDNKPHILTSPFFQLMSHQVNIAPYRKSKPTMIAPYELPLDSFDEYSRCAWVIPVRGQLPWPESSSAVLLDSPQDPPAPSNTQMNEFTWTTSSVRKFWEFLIGIREARNIGSLGISFHAAPSSSPFPERSSRATRNVTTNTTDIGLCEVYMSSVDHFKIYHDWPRSSQLRNVLHAWSFESKGNKYRLFVGAKLVLLDNKSRGVMIL